MTEDTSQLQHGFRRSRRLTFADEAYEAIVEAIFDRRLEPGAQLTVRGLADELDMSTTPIREALTRAAAQRLVVQVSNRGCTVTPLLDDVGYHQLFGVRRQLEEYAVGTADPVEPAVAHLVDLARVMPHMEHGEVYRAFHDFNAADREFHLTLVRMAGNPFLDRAWSELHFHLHVGRLYTGSGVIDFGEALREHAAIADAVQLGDMQAAAALATRHIDNAEQRLIELVPGLAGSEVGR